MKFDIVIGNPPYNNDIYIPFVELGHQLSTQCSVFITPAKWQAKGGEKNEQFRKNIVPHMSKIVYYPCAQEVFDIRNLDGISYYIIDKSIHTEKEIINISYRQKTFNNKEIRELNWQLNNSADTIIKRIGNNKKLRNKICLDRSPFGYTNYDRGVDKHTEYLYELMAGDKSYGYVELTDKNIGMADKYKVSINTMNGNAYYNMQGTNLGMNKIYIYGRDKIIADPYLCLFVSDDEDECKSFESYLQTKLVRYLLVCSMISQHYCTEEMWRFVPDPGAFDHIFTDEELYAKYSLIDEEINIIESVIKERK